MKATHPVYADLTERQILITQYIADGATIKEVAVILGISYRSVDWHIEKMKRDLKAKTIAHLVAKMIRRGSIK